MKRRVAVEAATNTDSIEISDNNSAFIDNKPCDVFRWMLGRA